MRKTRARQRHVERVNSFRRSAEFRGQDKNYYQKQINWDDPLYWFQLAKDHAILENFAFSGPLLRWDRHAQARYRRRIRSLVRTAWNRYLRLKGKNSELSQAQNHD